jgi:hypothetical protein
LKEIIKNNILIFLGSAFLIGAVVISTADYFLWFDLSAEAKLNAIVLWLTSLAIFWYAYEAYQLKISTSKQTDNQEEIMLNEFLPILAPAEKKQPAVLQNSSLKNFYIHNFGKGPAKYVEVYVGRVKVCSDHSVSKGEDEEIRVKPESRTRLKELLCSAPAKLSVKICYEDIYGRRFKTVNIVLDKNAKDRYTIRRGKWDFERID